MRLLAIISTKKSLLALLVLSVGLLIPVQSLRAQSEGGQPKSQAAGQSSTPESASPDANAGEKDENEAYLHSDSVKFIGKKLGLTTKQAATAFQLANFAVLAVVLGWLMLKTLPKVFRGRTTTIQKSLVDARTATEDASARLSSVEERLSKLDGQIAAMKAQAEKDSAADEQRIKSTVEEEKQKILAAAEQEIAAATIHAQRQIQQYAAELAIEQAARKLVVSAETDRLLVQNFARKLTGGTKGGQN